MSWPKVVGSLVAVALFGGCGGEDNEGEPSQPVAEGDAVLCLRPESEFFTYFATGSNYTDDTSITSFAYAYPSGLTTGFGDTMRVGGTVGTSSGVGISFGACVDASEYSGIEFDIWGDVGPTGTLTVYAGTRGNDPEPPFTETGTCEPSDPSQPYFSCTDSYTTLVVSPTASRANIAFSSFHGGRPHSGVDPSELLDLFLVFDWNPSQTPYPIDLDIGDMSFAR